MFRSIRVQLVFIGLLVALPAFFLIFELSEKFRTEVQNEAEVNATRLVRNLVTQQENLIEATRHVLVTAVQVPAAATNDLASCSDFFTKLDETLESRQGWKNFGGFVRINKLGRIDCSSVKIRPGTDVSDRPYFKKAMATKSFVMTDMIISRGKSRLPIIILAQPILTPRGDANGVLVVGIRTTWLARSLEANPLPEGVTATLVDGKGKTFGHFPADNAPIGQSVLTPTLLDALSTQTSGVVDNHTSKDGDSYMVAFEVLPNTTVNIVLSTPVSSINAQARAVFLNSIGLYSLLVLSALAVAWWWGATRIANPIAVLTKTADNLHSGDMEARSRLPDNRTELFVLSRAFDSMADDLKQRMDRLTISEKQLTEARDHLEQRVQERTKSLKEEIATRIQTEHDLRASQQQLAMAQAIAHLGSWTWHIDDNSALWSDELFRIFGYQPGEVEPRYELFLDSVAPEYLDGVVSAVARTLEQDAPFNLEFQILRPDRSARYVAAQGIVIRDGSGKPIRMTGTILDITENKEIEAQLIQSTKLASIGEMATELAHELNQPLNVIRLASSNVVRKHGKGTLSDDVVIDKMNKISGQVDRAKQLIDHMKVFARKDTSSPDSFDVRDAIQCALEMVSDPIRIAEIELITTLPDSPVPLYGFQIRLEQVCINLINNARQAIQKHRPEGGGKIEISVTVDATQPQASIQISDNGGGIPTSDIDQIFDPFFTTKAAGQGTGLGLSIVHRIVTEIGARIAFSNTDDGAAFTISLPLSVASEGHEDLANQR